MRTCPAASSIPGFRSRLHPRSRWPRPRAVPSAWRQPTGEDPGGPEDGTQEAPGRRGGPTAPRGSISRTASRALLSVLSGGVPPAWRAGWPERAAQGRQRVKQRHCRAETPQDRRNTGHPPARLIGHWPPRRIDRLGACGVGEVGQDHGDAVRQTVEVRVRNYALPGCPPGRAGCGRRRRPQPAPLRAPPPRAPRRPRTPAPYRSPPPCAQCAPASTNPLARRVRRADRKPAPTSPPSSHEGSSHVEVPIGSFASLAPTQAIASSHREAPLISGQPQYDNTDLYAFVSPDRPDTTTLIANWIPFEDPAGGPNFYKFATDARYDINIDTDGEGGADLTYRWTFKDRVRNGNTFLYNTGPVTSLDDQDLNFRQTYALQLVRRKGGIFQSSTTLLKDVPVAPSNVGRASMPDYATLRNQAVRPVPGGGNVFAGQADDSFYLDLRVFDLLYGGNLSEVGNDTLRGYNVNTVAIQVPSELLRSNDKQPIIGVWTTTSRGSALSDFRQVSRLGMPLVNEVVIPRKDKDKFNASVPWKDAQFAKYV